MSQPKGEFKAVNLSKYPFTQNDLANAFRNLGLKAGDIVIVHSSMSKIGWIPGTSVSVINALQDILTSEGTLVMPTFSTDYTEPSNWQNPPVPKEWWPIIREHIPAYNPKITPTRGMGIIPETFRNYPDTLRSGHPHCSFTAWGKHKNFICSEHPLIPVFGEKSPLAKLYQLQAKILLLGVNHHNNTSLHLAEVKASLANHPKEKQGAAIMENGKRIWRSWEDFEYEDEDFQKIGSEYEELSSYTLQKVGLAETRTL